MQDDLLTNQDRPLDGAGDTPGVALVILDGPLFLQTLAMLEATPDLLALREGVQSLLDSLVAAEDQQGLIRRLPPCNDETAVTLRRAALLEQLQQIVESRTLERARYYLERLRRGLQELKTNAVNDINLLRWKEYDELLTDSLWLVERRDSSGAHLGWYWGNYVPQIPHQMLLRYTRRGDWVLDPFLGSGTTLIECRRLGRHGLGIELSAQVASRAEELIAREPNAAAVVTQVAVGDNRSLDLGALLRQQGISEVQLLLLHPPYHDIIRFSDHPADLSGADSVDDFLTMFGQTLDNVSPYLERGRYCALVIGDKYARGEWVPLGFLCMQELLSRGYTLKSIVVKNFEETRGKRSQKELWRYRALVGGFYVFKHEYIFIFRKP